MGCNWPVHIKYIVPLLGTKQLKPYQLGTYWRGGQDIYEAGWRGGEAYLKLKRYERVVFYRFSKRGYALYKAGRRGGRAIKLAGKLCPVLCMFGFNCSVPK